MYLQSQETRSLKDIKMTNSILGTLNIMRGMFNNSFFIQSKGAFCIEIKSAHQEIFLQKGVIGGIIRYLCKRWRIFTLQVDGNDG
jgi:hypothetical protein